MDLKKIRLEKGWSQEQLADISDVSARTVQRIEKGGAAGLETQKALAAAFDLSLPEFKKQTSGNQEHETMSTIAGIHIPKKWKGFFLHLITFMIVVTWLFGLAYFFDLDNQFIVLIGFTWAVFLLIQIVNLINPEK